MKVCIALLLLFQSLILFCQTIPTGMLIDTRGKLILTDKEYFEEYFVGLNKSDSFTVSCFGKDWTFPIKEWVERDFVILEIPSPGWTDYLVLHEYKSQEFMTASALWDTNFFLNAYEWDSLTNTFKAAHIDIEPIEIKPNRFEDIWAFDGEISESDEIDIRALLEEYILDVAQNSKEHEFDRERFDTLHKELSEQKYSEESEEWEYMYLLGKAVLHEYKNNKLYRSIGYFHGSLSVEVDQYIYDKKGRLKHFFRDATMDGSMEQIDFEYDRKGRVSKVSFTNYRIIWANYDEQLECRDEDHNSISFTYSKTGRIATKTEFSDYGTNTCSYKFN